MSETLVRLKLKKSVLNNKGIKMTSKLMLKSDVNVRFYTKPFLTIKLL